MHIHAYTWLESDSAHERKGDSKTQIRIECAWLDSTEISLAFPRPAKFSRSKGDPKCATFEPPRRVRTGMIKPVISGKFPNPIGQATRLIPCRRDGEFFMEFLQQLKSLQPQQDNTPAIQLRRAIGSLRHAGRNSDALAPRQRKLFERRMEKMCCDLSLWLEAVSVREIH